VNPDPLVSIIIPAYESHETLENCLRSLEAQDTPSFEVILVDSSPSDRCGQIVAESFPWVRYEHVGRRMLPHEARNYGVTKSTAGLLIFTDPDIYPPPGWISRLLRDHSVYGGLIVGSVSCFGSGWVDQGLHLSKFDLWLPGGEIRTHEIAPTMNLLCPRAIYEQVGGFPGEQMIGDTMFSWDVAALGYEIHFSPLAQVLHHHVSSWFELLTERYARGREFGQVRMQRGRWSNTRILAHLLLTITPFRWMKLMLRTLRNARSANLLSQAIRTLPIIASAHAAWLAGESRAFLESLIR
jgi:glycosyltransferase involved in cell wall biosynthesis